MAWSQPEQVGHAVVWRWLSWRCWLAESSTSSWAVPTQSSYVTQSSCRASAQEMLLLRSAAPGPGPAPSRRREGITRCLPHHEQTLVLVFSQPRPGQCSGAGAGGEVFLGAALQHLLLNQHHVLDCVCGNHQTLTGAACSHRNTGTEGNN